MNFTKKYQEINIVKQGSAEITYGIIHGNNTIVFVKVGMEGSIYGYKNKYYKIATKLNKIHGCTVIVASNPNGYEDDFDGEMKSLKAFAYYHKWDNYKVYYVGNSNGGCLGILHAHKYPEIKKVICINGPLMINPQLLISSIQDFKGEKLYLVYGSKDPSFSLLNTFSELESDKVQIIRINGVGHYLKESMQLFLALPGFLLFGDKIESKKVKIDK